MEWSKCLWISLLALVLTACGDQAISSFDNHRINALTAQVDENSEAFVQKDVRFDQVITWAGQRTVGESTEPIKMKLFHYGDLVRGYFNLKNVDDKNLQVFGKKVDGMWVLKCVTKVNTEEADGYMILDTNGSGIWSNGKVNFEKGFITLLKQDIDYNSLKEW